MVYTCIILSPARYPNMWAIAQPKFSKGFHVPLLWKSYKFTYPNECTELFTCFYTLLQDIFIEFQIPIKENAYKFLLFALSNLSLSYTCKQRFIFVL